MTRATRTLVATSLAAALLTGIGAAPAAAADKIVNGTGVVHAGYYPDKFHSGGASGLGDDLGPHAAATGHRVSLAGYFMDVTETPAPGSEIPGTFNNTIQQLNEVWAGQATPFINLNVGALSTSLIAAGAGDVELTRWASYLKRWLEGENLNGTNVSTAGRSLIIAPLPEMNWSGGEPYQCQASTFASAYNHIVAVVETVLGPANSENVRWAFAPNNATGVNCGSIASYYAGLTTVDFMAFSGYNFYTVVGPNETPAQVMGAALNDLKLLAPTKPIIIAQTASCAANETRATWISNMFNLAATDFHVLGFVWFNQLKECDWRIWDGATADAAWDSALDGATYAFPISDWFLPGTTLVVGVSDTIDPCPPGRVCDSVSVIDQNVQP